MRNKSDAELMRMVMEKNRPALEELYDRYIKLVYSFAIKATKDEQKRPSRLYPIVDDRARL